MSADLRKDFTKNAEEFDALMMEMLGRNKELERALKRSLDAFEMMRMAGEKLPHWHCSARKLLK